VPFGAFCVIDYLAGNAETVEDAVRTFERAQHLVTAVFPVEVTTQPTGEAVLRFVPAAHLACGQGIVEGSIAVVVGRLRARCTCPPDLGIALPRQPPVCPRAYGRLLGARVRFGASEPSITFAPGCWRAPLRRPDPTLRRLLDHLVEKILPGGAPLGLELAVRRVLHQCPEGERPTAGQMARALGLSERTLHRRLAATGTGYAEILEQHRRAEAERLLTDSRLPIAEIARRLGYATATSFHRAFLRWHGLAPGTWRRRGT
jgi:AraC-like DNA-binding protein